MKLQLTDLVATTNKPTSAPATQKKGTMVKAKAVSSLFDGISRTTEKKSQGTTAGKRSGFLGRLGEQDSSDDESDNSSNDDSDTEIRSKRPASLLSAVSTPKKQKTKQCNGKSSVR